MTDTHTTAPGSLSERLDGLGREDVYRLDREHVFHSWSAQALIEPLPIQRALGSYFWDYEGKRYLDFSSQLVNINIGYQHPKVVAAIQEQAARLTTIQPAFANDARSEAARLIAEVAPEGLDCVFFTNGGAEANENALRMARLHTGRQKVLATYRSYHGATAGSITLTGDPRRWPSEPGQPGIVHFWGPYTYRSSFHSENEEQELDRALAHPRDTLMVEGPHTVAAVILETVTGTNGIIPPPDGYLQAIREVCDRHGILLILDEVMAGFGRTGRWFACEHWDVVPDIITVAKGINSGYVPLGAMIARGEIVDQVRGKFFPGGLTYAGHPLACASAIASIEAFQEEGVVENAAAVGSYLGDALRGLADRHPSIGDDPTAFPRSLAGACRRIPGLTGQSRRTGNRIRWWPTRSPRMTRSHPQSPPPRRSPARLDA